MLCLRRCDVVVRVYIYRCAEQVLWDGWVLCWHRQSQGNALWLDLKLPGHKLEQIYQRFASAL
jgi:hypothetical protein